jgi:DNA polymerase
MPANTIADAMNAMYGPPIAAIADSVRGFIQASPGKRIVAVDFASIEARLTAWAADEFDTLELYESGADLYIHEAAKINSVDPTTIDKKDPRRQEGKVAILALGYGGGAGALGKMAKNYGLELTEEKKKWIVDQWRIAHPKIAGKRRAEGPDKGKLLFEGGRPAQPGIWQEMEAAAIAALRTRNTKFPFANGKGFFIAGKTMLHMALPSDRMLRYPKARLVQDDYGRYVIEYYSKNPVNSNVWGFYRIWGGTFFENFIQAVARDLLVWLIIGAEENDYPVIMHVHDEPCVEVDTDIAEACYEKLVQLARRRPAWGTNIPMDGAGWIGVRFRKG